MNRLGVLLLAGLIGGVSATTECYKCTYDTDTSTPDKNCLNVNLDYYTCEGVCGLYEITTATRTYIQRNCQSASCSGKESINLSNVGEGTKTCCATKGCNSTNILIPSLLLTMALSAAIFTLI